MPLYEYECADCGHADSEFQHMRENHLTCCPKCGGQYRRLVSLPHTDLKEFATPIQMYSIGLTDDEEIREFKRRCPDVDVSMNPGDELYGIPIARSRKQKRAALDAVGFEEKK